MRESFEEGAVVSSVDSIPFIGDLGSEDGAPIVALVKEKAGEFSREKAACRERVSYVAQLVCKQLKGIADSRLK